MNPQLQRQIRRAQPRRQVVKAPRLFALPKSELDRLKVTPRVHLAALQAGLGDENKFATLAFRVFTAKGLAELLSPESKGHADMTLYPALTALWRIGDRTQRLGRIGLSGDDLRILEEALDIADKVQDATYRREALEVYQKVQNMVGTLAFTMQSLEPYRLV